MAKITVNNKKITLSLNRIKHNDKVKITIKINYSDFKGTIFAIIKLTIDNEAVKRKI